MFDGLSQKVRKSSSRRNKTVLICLVLVVITLSAYMKAGECQFFDIDDGLFTNNPHVTGGITFKNIAWAFTCVDVEYWHPLTWISHMADVQLFGMNPRGHHLTNVGIHSASALLLFFLL